MCYTADMAATRLDQAVMEGSPKWARWARQAEGPFVVFLLDFLYFSVELFANFCLGLFGTFWDSLGLFPLDHLPSLRFGSFAGFDCGPILIFHVMLGSRGYKICWYHPAWVVEDCKFSPKSLQNVSTSAVSCVFE